MPPDLDTRLGKDAPTEAGQPAPFVDLQMPGQPSRRRLECDFDTNALVAAQDGTDEIAAAVDDGWGSDNVRRFGFSDESTPSSTGHRLLFSALADDEHAELFESSDGIC